MNTNSFPSRGSTQRAGRATQAADSPFSGGFRVVRGRFRIIRERRLGEQVALTFRLFGQARPLLEWIGIVGIGNVFRFGPGKRFEWAIDTPPANRPG